MVYVPRANASFPPIWLSLRWNPVAGDPAAFISSACAKRLPLDLTRNAALWRSGLNDDSLIVAVGGREAANALNEEHAANLVEASIFQASCSLGQNIGVFLLDLQDAWKTEQIRGALSALELARTDGIVKFSGLSGGNAETVKSVWLDHDGFEFVLMPEDAWTDELIELCKKRGVASIASVEEPRASQCGAAISLAAVRSLADIDSIAV